MFTTAFTLSLLGLTSATPLARRDSDTPPPLSTSKGFDLVIKLSDPSKDFNPPVQNTFVSSIHVGAGLDMIGNTHDSTRARIFYQNGTHGSATTVITDSGNPPIPAGFKLYQDKDGSLNTGSLDVGPGTPGIELSSGPEAYLEPETFYACNETVQYYPGRYFIVIRHSDTGVAVPEQCRAVRLVPQCTALNELPATGGIKGGSSHEFALDSPCYVDAFSM